MARISLENLSKSYGALSVIRDIDLRIDDGEMLVLVGPSGCGKSTLLRMIAGLETVSSGAIRIDGKKVNDIDPRDRDIAMVFQSYALYPHKTVFENITFGLKMRHMRREEIRKRADDASAALGLDQYLDRYPGQLSGGQRQRVAMGRALVREPKAFLFDEPLSNLDAQLRVQMRMEIRALQRKLGVTSVYVTHDQIEAMTMGDRIAVMQGGDIVQVGAPLEIYDRPANAFVATFIGSPAINLFDARIGEDGQSAVTPGGLALPVAGAAITAGAPVRVGIRPEHLRIAPEGTPAIVEAVEQTGLDTLLIARAGDTALRVLIRDRQYLRIGEEVRLASSPGDVHVFTPEGAALR
ncbi:sn-glycerol-3-phosphate ABC transporter ATP-binding protein UgpC [Sinirhodobacter populi]|uniref:sn-glycerol-3-phosphate ABC transporter ATP-binding protein UgpC n=1 Tax=Paenirhodobacter populi TaxID=2306993 RepID=A0A443K8H0_9RHOB|nr:sn-glycerol-3-phosphate ABC transporter ATP-binding protein UgpC [Sinirhodobacter populi]RWR29081.1 sn-glycerol-3-phosphate ABC transporter ATP-binding protein UgpC [Sinirhodobacter populi]